MHRWARFRRWLHLLACIPRYLRTGEDHRTMTILTFDKTSICCTCGREF